MPRIKQLPSHEAQKIAAGEVVERPANIVKELIENSIDAGATRISIYIEDGGKQLIRVIDNGSGMDASDAQRCFDRHATSKISQVQELDSINTFGFRGEALASIASVSTITLLTKEENSLEGTQVIIEANSIKNVGAIACATGTDISIANLFFNVPARQKFLKATQTEWRAIQLLINAFAFDYPHIHFSLFTENKQVLNCPAVDTILNRALQLWDQSTHKNLIELQSIAMNNITIFGVIGDYHQYKYDRSGIYIFVNKRWVKNHQLANDLIKGFANTLPPSRYPVAVLCIEVLGTEVDINIHPRKEEVKFLHPRRVEMMIQNAVKTALEKKLTHNIQKKDAISNNSYTSFDFDENFKEDKKRFLETSFDTFVPQSSMNLRSGPPYEEVSKYGVVSLPPSLKLLRTDGMSGDSDKASNIQAYNNLSISNKYAFINTDNQTSNITQESNQDTDLNNQQGISDQDSAIAVKNNITLIGQFKNTYLLVEQDDGLFLIDQHAAHERILYELFANRFHEVATVQLLFPSIITMTDYETNSVVPYLDILHSNGIIIEQASSNQLIVQSLPVHLKEQSIEELIKEVIIWIEENASLDENILKKTINNKLQAQMACKAAVKAGDVLTQEKMRQLLEDLSKTANRFSCPHGRPTSWLLPLHEIEKKFKRRL